MTCEACGTPFPPGPRRGKPRRWCTDACRRRARHTADTRRALAELDAVRACLTGPGFFGVEAKRDSLRCLDRAAEALQAVGQPGRSVPPDAAPPAPRSVAGLLHDVGAPDTLREVRIGLLVARAQVDDLLALVTRP